MNISQRIIFFTILISVLLLIQFLVFKTFRNYLNSKRLTGKIWKRLSLYPFIIFSVPFIYLFVYRKFTLPDIIYDVYIIPFFIFQVSVFFIGIYIVIGKLIKLPFVFIKFIARKFELVRNKYDSFVRKKSVVKFDNSRRTFIKATTFLVSGYAFTGASIGVVLKDNFQIVKQDIELKNLPENLKGLRIVQVNDIHSGPFMDVELMNKYVRVINDLNPDLIFIPGDLVNSALDEVYMFNESFKNLKSKYGTYATLGNHDYFSDANLIAEKVINETPIKLLRNKSELIKINEAEFMLMGMEDTPHSGVNVGGVIHGYLDESIKDAISKVDNSEDKYSSLNKILLYHKPYLFPNILDKNIDLILSGHTHGGQVVLFNLDVINISIASMVSPYIQGLYKKGNSQMYISSGIGTVGLPIRLNCPPEITVLQLV
jgi:uncharacterized protein